MKNVPQPDLTLIVLPSHGGQVRIDDDGYIAGGPELVAEISASTVSLDLNTKFRVYQRNRVREYIVWRVYDDEIDWYVQRGCVTRGSRPTRRGSSGARRSPGCGSMPRLLIRLDLLRVLQVLQQGIASPEHAGFVDRLAKAAAKPADGA